MPSESDSDGEQSSGRVNTRNESTQDESSEEDEEDEEGDNEEISPSRLVRSNCPSPTDSLVEHVSAMGLDCLPMPPPPQMGRPESESEPKDTEDVSGIVSSELLRQRKHQRKFNSKRGSRRVGRPRGSKAKQDLRVNLKNDVWG